MIESEQILFRNATEDDVKYIVSLAFSQMNKFLEKAYSGNFSWEKWENEIREVIFNQNNQKEVDYSLISQFTRVLIIENRSSMTVGFIWFSFYSREIIWIDTIILDPEFQRQGLGGQIISSQIENFNKQFKFLDLGVQEENVKAIKFYEKLGFYKIDDIGMAYYLTNRMRKNLQDF
jgi:ribosomal protein S18 acetylase RimI-like enzyme